LNDRDRSIPLLSARLRGFLRSESIFELVDSAIGSGWLDGGCLILAEAVILWLADDRAHIVGITGDRDGGTSPLVDHVAVAVGRYIDGDGIATVDVYLSRWAELEDFVSAHFVADAWRPEQAGIVSSIETSTALAAHLSVRFDRVTFLESMVGVPSSLDR
jgi:hypothetical protein